MKLIKKHTLNNQGITLVELLIYLGLSVIMLVVLSELFITILNESVETQNYSAVQTDGRYIMARFRSDINNADSVSVPSSLGETSNELRLTIEGNELRYYLSGNGLYLNDGTGDYLMSSYETEVTELSFTKTGNAGGKQIVNISFQISSEEAGTAQQESQTFKGSGGLR